MSVNESRNGALSSEGAPATGAPSLSHAAASAPAAPPESARISEVTCIRCPLGCAITVDVAPDGAAVYREGASCARGREYAVAEVTAPVRSVATTINVPGCGEPLSVKTADPIPKPLIADAVRHESRSCRAPRPHGRHGPARRLRHRRPRHRDQEPALRRLT